MPKKIILKSGCAPLMSLFFMFFVTSCSSVFVFGLKEVVGLSLLAIFATVALVIYLYYKIKAIFTKK